jgi:hypothetical protein
VAAEAVPARSAFERRDRVVTSPAAPGTNQIEPSALSDGYNNNTCAHHQHEHLRSSHHRPQVHHGQGPSVVANPANPAPVSTNVLIVNTFPNSSVTLQGIDFVKIDQGSIKATFQVKIVCTAVDCPVTVTNSELIATSTVTTAVNGGFGGPNGTLQVTANGDFSITTSTFTGGALVKFTSNNGSITAVCQGGGAGACQDLRPAVPDRLANCGSPPDISVPPSETRTGEADLSGGTATFCDGSSEGGRTSSLRRINLEQHHDGGAPHGDQVDTGPIKAMGFDLTIPAAVRGVLRQQLYRHPGVH